MRRAEPEGTPERCEEWAAADALALHLRGLWGCRDGRPFVVFTGGEPLLQFDAALVVACRERGFGVAVETNGTLPLPCALDWVWVSPKAGAPLALDRADEVKLVFPQDGLAPEELEHIAALHRWLLPMDGPALEANTKAALAYCLEHPRWRLNIQVYQNVLGRAGEAGGRA